MTVLPEKQGEKPRFVLLLLWSSFGLALVLLCSYKRKAKENQKKTRIREEQDQNKTGRKPSANHISIRRKSSKKGWFFGAMFGNALCAVWAMFGLYRNRTEEDSIMRDYTTDFKSRNIISLNKNGQHNMLTVFLLRNVRIYSLLKALAASISKSLYCSLPVLTVTKCITPPLNSPGDLYSLLTGSPLS